MNIAAFAAASRGIERQEAEGQRNLVERAMLPKQVFGATREQLTALGFIFGDEVDELFVTCELPPGWTKRATDHSMHSDLLDEQGRLRAEIFYKAAFYDRRADMRMLRRYAVEVRRGGSIEQMRRVDVTDNGQVIKEFGEAKLGDWDGLDALEKEAKAWLTQHHPEWQSALAYW